MWISARWIAVAAFVLLCVGIAAPACSDDDGRTFTPGIFTATTTTPTHQGGNAAFDPCACLETGAEETDSSQPCTACKLETVDAGGRCTAEQNACANLQGCVEITNCVGACNALGVDLDCIGNCVYTLPTPQAHETYMEFLECLCTNCFTECDTNGDAECIPEEGSGGAGGAGGGNVGGAGGQGGATGGNSAGGQGGA